MFRRAFFGWGIVLFAVSITGHPAYARTWYVLPDGSGDAPTIQAAIDSSSTGDTILVAPGFYSITEDINIREQDELYLISEAGAGETVIDAGGRDLYVNIGDSYFDMLLEVVVSGFTFQFFEFDAIAIDGIERVVIEENIIRYNGDDGISVGICTECYIRNNVIYSNTYGIAGAWSNGMEITSNTIAYNTMAGVLLAQYYHYVMSNNVISNNYFGLESHSSDVDFTCNNVSDNVNNYAYYLSDQTGINGNISAPPQYCAVYPLENGNFYFQSDSPCVPGNHPDGESCGLIGALPVGCSTTANKVASWGFIKLLYR